MTGKGVKSQIHLVKTLYVHKKKLYQKEGGVFFVIWCGCTTHAIGIIYIYMLVYFLNIFILLVYIINTGTLPLPWSLT